MSESSSKSSSGVYKSRLLNFINRRSQQLMDQSKTVLRHLQVTTIWGIQIALYPVYLLVQTTQTFVRQIQQSTTKNQTQLSESEISQSTLPPASDQPIKQVLDSVESFLDPEQISGLIAVLGFRNLATSPKLGSNHQTQILGLAEEAHLSTKDTSIQQESTGTLIQSVACLLESKALVLVDTHNQILDILTPVQQQKLAEKIIWEIANYCYDRRQFLQSQRPVTNQLPQPTSSNVFLPARWFWKLMAWVQQGEVAIATDLFQESRLINPSPRQNFLQLPSFSFPRLAIDPETLSNFDRQIYQVEEDRIVPTSQWLIHIGEEILPMIIHLERFIPQNLANRNSHQSLTSPKTNSRDLIDGNQSSEIDSSKANSQEDIWQLIQAAIAYFFGKKPAKLNPDAQSSSEPSNSILSSFPSSLDNSLNNSAASATYPELPFSDDDWLDTEDLFPKTSLSQVNPYQDEMMLDVPSLAENKADTQAETKMLAPTNSPSWIQVMAAKFKRFNPQRHKITNQSSTKSSTKSPGSTSLNKSSDPTSDPQRKLPPAQPLFPIHGSSKRQNYQQQKPTQRSTQESIQRSNPMVLDRSQPKSQKSSELVNITTENSSLNSSLTNNSPDWIETEVTSKGYVKHPLQKSIEILDEIVLGIEKLFSWFWNLIKSIVKI